MRFSFRPAEQTLLEEPVRKRTRRRISSESESTVDEPIPQQQHKRIEENLNIEISDQSISASPASSEPFATSSPYPLAMPDSKSSKASAPSSTVNGGETIDREPPELQVMVSETELWLINERNNKQKSDENEVSCDKETNNRMDVVITDVRAHDYSVIIKECYSPAGFFRSSR